MDSSRAIWIKAGDADFATWSGSLHVYPSQLVHNLKTSPLFGRKLCGTFDDHWAVYVVPLVSSPVAAASKVPFNAYISSCAPESGNVFIILKDIGIGDRSDVLPDRTHYCAAASPGPATTGTGESLLPDDSAKIKSD